MLGANAFSGFHPGPPPSESLRALGVGGWQQNFILKFPGSPDGTKNLRTGGWRDTEGVGGWGLGQVLVPPLHVRWGRAWVAEGGCGHEEPRRLSVGDDLRELPCRSVAKKGSCHRSS